MIGFWKRYLIFREICPFKFLFACDLTDLFSDVSIMRHLYCTKNEVILNGKLFIFVQCYPLREWSIFSNSFIEDFYYMPPHNLYYFIFGGIGSIDFLQMFFFARASDITRWAGNWLKNAINSVWSCRDLSKRTKCPNRGWTHYIPLKPSVFATCIVWIDWNAMLLSF